MVGPRKSHLTSTILSILLLITGWLAFAPGSLGGRSGYMKIVGNSMSPGYARGDLVIVRQASRYQPGDIVAYQHPDLGLVFHRIIGEEGGQFLLKGDNNGWTDSYQPLAAEIVGKHWIHLPGAGKFLDYLRDPARLPILIFVLVLFSLLPIFGLSLRRRRGRAPQTAADPPPEPALPIGGSWQHELQPILLAVLLASVVLILLGWKVPISREQNDTLQAVHSGEFAYSGEANARVYDTAGFTPGDPIFRQLSDQFSVSFSYRLDFEGEAEVSGSQRLILLLSDDQGWKRVLEVAPETSFTGSSAAIHGIVDLGKVQALIDEMEASTGVRRVQYSLYISPQVKVSGRLNGIGFVDQFHPDLAMRIDPLQVRMIAAGESLDDELRPEAEFQVEFPVSAPNRLDLLFVDLEVATARRLGLGGLLISLIGLAALRQMRIRLENQGEDARIATALQGMLIDINQELEPDDRLVRVNSIDDLVLIAERLGAMILRQMVNDRYQYLVPTAGGMYCFLPALAAARPETAADWQPASPTIANLRPASVVRSAPAPTRASASPLEHSQRQGGSIPRPPAEKDRSGGLSAGALAEDLVEVNLSPPAKPAGIDRGGSSAAKPTLEDRLDALPIPGNAVSPPGTLPSTIDGLDERSGRPEAEVSSVQAGDAARNGHGPGAAQGAGNEQAPQPIDAAVVEESGISRETQSLKAGLGNKETAAPQPQPAKQPEVIPAEIVMPTASDNAGGEDHAPRRAVRPSAIADTQPRRGTAASTPLAVPGASRVPENGRAETRRGANGRQEEDRAAQRRGEVGDRLQVLKPAPNDLDSLLKYWEEYYSQLIGWVQQLDAMNREAHGHSQRVTRSSVLLARALGLEGVQLEKVWLGALLHDVGMADVPRSILHKDSYFTAQDWEFIVRHPEHGYQRILGLPDSKREFKIPFHHHERWTGSGYPDRLEGERIPLEARLFAVVDVWDSMLHERSYRKAFSEEMVLDYLQLQSGKQFDPRIVKTFSKLVHQAPKVMENV